MRVYALRIVCEPDFTLYTITSLNTTINLCVQYTYEDSKFVMVLSAKMQHTQATYSQWYERVVKRRGILTVVQRINHED